MMETLADQLQARLRSDLRLAMRERRAGELSVLRCLMAAIDNAQAVPIGTLHDHYAPRAFGDASVEVSRRALTADDLRRLLANEKAARIAAAEDYRGAGRPDHAEALLAEVDIIGRYERGDRP